MCSTGGGLSTGAKVGGGIGLALVTLGGVKLLGGDAPAVANPPGTTGPATPPGAPPQDPQGNYGLNWNILEDIRNSAIFLLFQNAREARVAVTGAAAPSLAGGLALAGSATVTIAGDPPLPTLMGTWDRATQQIMATGAGPAAGRPRVGVSLQGTLTPAGVLTATVSVGEDGSLGPPLPHIVRYGLVGTKRP